MNTQIEQACSTIWIQCMGLKPGEKALVVTDDKKMALGLALYHKAQEIGAQAVLVLMPPSSVSGMEPPESIAAAMCEADVIVCPTHESITHTNARINAVNAGARIATMPGITEAMFCQGPITADYTEVESITAAYTQLLSTASNCRIITQNGCELVMSLENRLGIPSPGVYKKSGQAGNLPSGEAYIAPVEHSANGTYCINGSVVGVGLLEEPVILTIQQGLITGIEGKEAALVEKAIPGEPLSRTIGELGIGTNPKATITGVILEDEKIYGSVHIAFGTNTSFGGVIKANSHIDCVTLNPSVYLDDKLVVENGRLTIC